MIGYVKIYKPELRVIDYELYRAVYCSLCRQMGKLYGPFARFALNYDFTFLSLLEISQKQECPVYKKARCVFNPLVRCNNVKECGDELSYAADAAIITSYYKVKDNLKDRGISKRIKAGLVYPLFALFYRKAKKRSPKVDEYVKEYIAAQDEVESRQSDSIDKAAEPTAVMLQRLFEDIGEGDISKRVLSRIGYCIGKWIYLMDAADDLESDVKLKNYNVLAVKFGIKEYDELLIKKAREYITFTLNVCRTEAAASAQLLDVNRYHDIIDNILYLGLEYTQNNVILRKKVSKNTYALSDK